MTLPFPALPDFLKEVPMGVVVHSYAARWNSKANSSKYPAFTNAIELMEHCASIGAGGVQTVVRGWASDFAKKARDRREKLGLYLEGSIGLPGTPDDVANFEKEVLASKEAGVSILRTVCLSGRRYENFKTADEFAEFKRKSMASLALAEPVVKKHKMKLAVENHKDWRYQELIAIMKEVSSEWVGVTLDFGNNVALLEDPMDVINGLAPYAFSTHVKDMGVKDYSEGFLLSEVPLGQGIVDLKAAVAVCKKHNPNITFNLEMITRDPLEVPVLTDGYWGTSGELPASVLAQALRTVKTRAFSGELPKTTGLSAEERLAFEEENNLACLKYSTESLGLK